MLKNQLDIPQKGAERILFEIPDFNHFGEILHERLHAILYHYEEWSSKFMLLTNLFDRDTIRLKERRLNTPNDIEELIYCGTSQSRAILEKDPPIEYIKSLNLKKSDAKLLIKNWEKISAQGDHLDEIKQKWQLKRNPNWDFLRNKEMDKTDPYLESFPYFNRFRDNDLKFEDVKASPLNNYFEKSGDNFKNAFQDNEFPILSDYFNIKKDKFIGIPLLGMGHFQGIVWIIFKNEETKNLDSRTIKRIIKYFQVEYDNLVLDWDTTGENIKEKSFTTNALDQVNPTNPIQHAIGLKKYYDISDYYHNERIDQSDKVVDQIRAQFLKTAIITILLDSYAHNISAHSLTTLSWWFKERAEFLKMDKNPNIKEYKRDLKILGRSNNPLIKHHELGEQANLSKELAPLFKFLLEKGAFWSGITRQTNFTGKISSLYSILWHDFINNPLYLGTIANTERVGILHINITFYQDEVAIKGHDFKNKKLIATTKNGLLLSGNLASIDLTRFNKKGDSVFVHKGEQYELLLKELQATKAFFPGGVVGKHAFFTLLENEIRNVKHYDDPILKDIQENGLQLNISIHRCPVDSSKKLDSKELLKIGVWLNHKVELNKDLLVKRIKNLHENILSKDTFKPRLGGGFQDKICASMLMTNTFEKVQDKSSQLAKIYYPWIKTASAFIEQKEKGIIQEFEVSHRRFFSKENEVGRFKELDTIKGWGYLKKYFHLWSGANIVTADEKQAPRENLLENYARYRFLFLPPKSHSFSKAYKALGIIRLLKSKNKPVDIAAAYKQWLPIWLKKEHDSQNVAITFKKVNTINARLIYINGEVQFENKKQINTYNKKQKRSYKKILNKKEFSYAHGSSKITGKEGSTLTSDSNRFNYRSHGELVKRFGQGASPENITNMSDELAYELIETLLSNICIFDRRIYNRMVNTDSDRIQSQIERLQHYEDQLLLNIKDENLKEWKKVRSNGFFKYHFLVLHLSFIEHLKDNTGNGYNEDKIIDFINEQILLGTSPESVPDNFILVITTGRGRMAWWDKIKEDKYKEYARFTTFRPIESILGAVEDALEMLDDFNLKYNLTKLLFGS